MATGLMATNTGTGAAPAMTPTTPALQSSIYDPTTSAPNPSQETGAPQATNGGYGNYVNQAVSLQPPTATNSTQGSVAPADSGVQQSAMSQLMSPSSSAATQAGSQTSVGSGISDAVNNFGANNLGTGLGLGTPTLAGSGVGAVASAGEDAALSASADASGLGNIVGSGASAEGTVGAITGADELGSASAAGAGALTATSLTGIASGVGIGALAGQFIAGITGGNVMGASIGGAIGGGLGAAAIGTAAFSAIATSLGAFAGPIGIAAGAVLGSVIGGLFGGGKPTDATEVQGLQLANGKVNPIYQNSESDTGAKYSAANANIASAMNTGASNLAQYLISNGATVKGNVTNDNPNLVIKVGSRDGIQIGTQNESSGEGGKGAPTAPVYTANLPASATQAQVQEAVNKTVLSLYNIPPDLQSQLQNVDMNNFYGSQNGTGNVSQGGPGIPLIGGGTVSASTSVPAVQATNKGK